MDFYAGQTLPFAGVFTPQGFQPTTGGSLSAGQYMTLFDVIGGTFGFNAGNFTLPTLPPLATQNQPISWVICSNGAYPESMLAFLGEVRLWPGPQTPQGWVPCDGSSLRVASYEALSVVLGTAFGGDGVSTFGLPRLQAPTGFRYLLATEGIFPNPNGTEPQVDYMLGTLSLFAGANVPSGFVSLTQPNLYPITQNIPLYSLLGDQFGTTNPSQNFALPQVAPVGGVQWMTPLQGIYPSRG